MKRAARRHADKHLLCRSATKNFTRQEGTGENQGKPLLVQNKAHPNPDFAAVFSAFAGLPDVPQNAEMIPFVAGKKLPIHFGASRLLTTNRGRQDKVKFHSCNILPRARSLQDGPAEKNQPRDAATGIIYILIYIVLKFKAAIFRR